jgi:UDP-N-acetylglucosamine 2-epimerase
MSRIRIALVFGTRPEAVKRLPVILLLLGAAGGPLVSCGA